MFGCVAYAHVSGQLRKKIDDKAEKYIFIGYSHETKGYKLYNPKTKNVIVSRDVTFDENCVWDWLSEEKNSLQMLVVVGGSDLDIDENLKVQPTPAKMSSDP